MIKTFYKNHMVLCHVILIGCVALFLCFFTFFFLDVWTNHGRTTLVPEVRKKSFEEATEVLSQSHLKYEIADSVYDSNSAPGTVKEMWPHPGTRVKPGRVIYLTVNSFQPQLITLTMPLTGVSSRQAVTYLESLNIRNIRIVYVPSNFSDLVVGATYKGKSLGPGVQIPVNANVVLEVGTVTESISRELAAKEQEVTTVDENEDESLTDEPEVSSSDEPQTEEPSNVSNPEAFD